MRTSEVSATLALTIAARLPVLLAGAPGVGKTDIVERAARDAGARLIVSHPVVADPTDAKGLPWFDAETGHATFLPFGELAEAMAATEPTVWFLDDLGQAPAAVQASFMQLLLARRINGHQIPDCVTFIAATNRRQDRAGVQGILEPVKSRFATIIEVEPHIDDWSGWAIDCGYVPVEQIAFLRHRPELLWQFIPSADMSNSPCPRTWAYAAKLQNAGIKSFEPLAGTVGQGPATEYLAFCAMYKSLVSVDAILLDPMNAAIPEKPAELYAVSCGLAFRANDLTFGRIAQYAERLHNGNSGEFAALIIRDSVRRQPDLQSTPAFLKLMTGPLGNMVLGDAR